MGGASGAPTVQLLIWYQANPTDVHKNMRNTYEYIRYTKNTYKSAIKSGGSIAIPKVSPTTSRQDPEDQRDLEAKDDAVAFLNCSARCLRFRCYFRHVFNFAVGNL